MTPTSSGDEPTVLAAMADLLGNFRADADRDAILRSVTMQAVTLIAGVDFANVLLVDGGQYRSVAATCPQAADVDALQIRTGEGPCLSAASSTGVVCSADLAAETRWPHFAAEAVAAGVHAAMSFPLFVGPPHQTHAASRGALNLFSTTKYEFGAEEKVVGAMLATLAAGALMAAERDAQLHSALGSRDVIGQAKGMLMERFDIDAADAFAMLVKLSQDTNVPLRTVARDVAQKS